MKWIKLLITILICNSCFAQEPSVFDDNITITTSNNTIVPLINYSGKKIMVLILPVTNTPDDLLYITKLDSICRLNSGNLVTIGILSYEDGFTDSLSDSLQLKYENLGDSNLVITNGMYTKKSSGLQQSDLCKWLTDKTLNGHFDDDITGINMKFFLSEQGELYGVSEPGIGLSIKLVQMMLNTQGN